MKIDITIPDMSGVLKFLTNTWLLRGFVKYSCVSHELKPAAKYRGDTSKLESVVLVSTFFGVEVERSTWYREYNIRWKQHDWFNSDGIEITSVDFSEAVKGYLNAIETEKAIRRRKEWIELMNRSEQ